jgi:hypothetical protein
MVAWLNCVDVINFASTRTQNQTGWEQCVGPYLSSYTQQYNSTYIDPLRKLESDILEHERRDVPYE